MLSRGVYDKSGGGDPALPFRKMLQFWRMRILLRQFRIAVFPTEPSWGANWGFPGGSDTIAGLQLAPGQSSQREQSRAGLRARGSSLRFLVAIARIRRGQAARQQM